MNELTKKKIIWIIAAVVAFGVCLISFLEMINLCSIMKEIEFYGVEKSFAIVAIILLVVICGVMGFTEYLVIKRLIPLFKIKEDE